MLAEKEEAGNEKTTPDNSTETTENASSEKSASGSSKQKCENCSCGQKCLSEKVEDLQLDRRKIDPTLIDF